MFKLIKKIAPIADKLILGGIFQKKGEAIAGSPAGAFHKPTVIKGIIQASLIALLVILFATGKLSIDQLMELIDKVGGAEALPITE
jgi:hypothetical protein